LAFSFGNPKAATAEIPCRSAIFLSCSKAILPEKKTQENLG